LLAMRTNKQLWHVASFQKVEKPTVKERNFGVKT
jgi:hypothetical protein